MRGIIKELVKNLFILPLVISNSANNELNYSQGEY